MKSFSRRQSAVGKHKCDSDTSESNVLYKMMKYDRQQNLDFEDNVFMYTCILWGKECAKFSEYAYAFYTTTIPIIIISWHGGKIKMGQLLKRTFTQISF